MAALPHRIQEPQVRSSGPRRVAVLVPCHNEDVSVARVVQDFRQALPSAQIFVYDNDSSDSTAEVARIAGAVVRREPRRGKGNVVRRMFSDIDADIYVLVDGDGTYHAASVQLMIDKLVEERLDMVVGTRQADDGEAAYRAGHRFGNRMLTSFVGLLFGRSFSDILSGYRVFSRRFAKSFPALAVGFETETELTIHALGLRMPIAEVVTPYGARANGSESKLNTYRDGIRISLTILKLFKEERPLLFFSILFAILSLSSLILAFPIAITYLETGLVPRFPTAILATGVMLLAFLSLASGFILDTVTHGRHELKRLFYLSIPPVE